MLHEGDTIPLSRTRPALDLTVLFNGFKPLFAALSPDDVNKLVLRDHPGLPGRGRHAGEPARPHGVGDQHAGRPRPGDRRPRDQPQRRDGDARPPGRRAVRPAGQRCADSSPGSPGDREAILGSLDSVSAWPWRRPGWSRNPSGPDHRRQAAAQGRRHPGPQQGRDRPGPAGAAGQAEQDRTHRDLRLLVQLLPVQLQGTGQAADGPSGSRATTTPVERGATSDEHALP